MIRLALMRHGHTSWNREHRIQGRSDIPLDDEAREILGQMRLPDGWDHAEIVSSPLCRAAETAQLVTGRDPRTESALMEMNWGDWEGQHGAALRADSTSGFRDIEAWGWDYSPPRGESPANLRERLVPWLDGLAQDTVAVCHIGTMRVALALAHDWDFFGPCPFTIKRNRLYTLTRSGSDWIADPDPERLVKK